MVWVIHFCSPVVELNQGLGTQKLPGEDRSAQTRPVRINSHAYTSIQHRIQLAVSDMTMSGWKPTISLIHPSHRWSHLFDSTYVLPYNEVFGIHIRVCFSHASRLHHVHVCLHLFQGTWGLPRTTTIWMRLHPQLLDTWWKINSSSQKCVRVLLLHVLFAAV